MPVDTRIDQSPYQEIESEGPMNQRVTIVPVPRIIEMYNVSERELDQIGQASTAFAMHLVFFGITFGASMAFLMSLLTAELTNRQLALVWALFVLVLATVYSVSRCTAATTMGGKASERSRTKARKRR